MLQRLATLIALIRTYCRRRVTPRRLHFRQTNKPHKNNFFDALLWPLFQYIGSFLRFTDCLALSQCNPQFYLQHVVSPISPAVLDLTEIEMTFRCYEQRQFERREHLDRGLFRQLTSKLRALKNGNIAAQTPRLAVSDAYLIRVLQLDNRSRWPYLTKVELGPCCRVSIEIVLRPRFPAKAEAR
jgi:hypothetical protein